MTNPRIPTDIPGPWLVLGISGPLSMCSSLHTSLKKAYELSSATASPWHAPNSLVRVGTNERLDAHAIMAAWRELGWPLPNPHLDEIRPES
jgi:hypothetical protein